MVEKEKQEKVEAQTKAQRRGETDARVAPKLKGKDRLVHWLFGCLMGAWMDGWMNAKPMGQCSRIHMFRAYFAKRHSDTRLGAKYSAVVSKIKSPSWCMGGGGTPATENDDSWHCLASPLSPFYSTAISKASNRRSVVQRSHALLQTILYPQLRRYISLTTITSGYDSINSKTMLQCYTRLDAACEQFRPHQQARQ